MQINDNTYKGYKEVYPSQQEWAKLYETPGENLFGCLENQYLIVYNPEGNNDHFKWSKGMYRKLTYKQVNANYTNKIKPRNMQQECAFDLLQDKNTTIKILTGRFGSGKPC